MRVPDRRYRRDNDLLRAAHRYNRRMSWCKWGLIVLTLVGLVMLEW